jgi:hypothetical protein
VATRRRRGRAHLGRGRRPGQRVVSGTPQPPSCRHSRRRGAR